MEWLVSYIMTVSAAGILSFLIDMLIPECNIKKASRFGIALIMTLMICAPVMTLLSQKQSLNVSNLTHESSINIDKILSSTQTSIQRLVRLSSGFENAQVQIQMEQTKVVSIEITNSGSSITDAVKRTAAESKLKEYLTVLYGVEANNIIIVQE